MIGRALAAPLCDDKIPSRLDSSLRAKLQSALVRLHRAESMEGAQQDRMLKKIRFSLNRARLETLRATTRRQPARRLSAACAVTIQRLIADEDHRIANP
jgi:hypothetical protein